MKLIYFSHFRKFIDNRENLTNRRMDGKIEENPFYFFITYVEIIKNVTSFCQLLAFANVILNL